MAATALPTPLDDAAAPNGHAATDERLLAVAERLFARDGIDGVSVRSITIEAEANIAAVHYHFGGKPDLVRALVERRVDEVNAARLVMLRAAERAPAVTARDIAVVWIEPLARLALDPERRAYLGFLVALQHAGPTMRALGTEAFRPHFPRHDVLLTRAFPHLGAPVRRMRFGLAVDMSMRALADLEHLRGPWVAAGESPESRELIDAIIDAFSGLLEGGTPIASTRPRVTAPEQRSQTTT